MSGHQAGIYRATHPIIAQIREETGITPTVTVERYGHLCIYEASVRTPRRFMSADGYTRREALTRLANIVKEKGA